MPASCTPVMPSEAISLIAASSVASLLHRWLAECASRPASSAVSTSTPVGLAGSVAHDLAAWRIRRRRGDAGELQRGAVHPDRMAVDARQIAGRSATTASSSRAVGKRRSFHSTWFQPRPMTQRAFGFAAMCLRIRAARIVDATRVAQVDLRRFCSPSPSTWPCASIRPGSSVLPPPSMTVAPAFAA